MQLIHRASLVTPATWASKGGAWSPLDFEIFSKKKLFFQFRGVKSKFHHFWSPLEKFWKNPRVATPWKKPSDAHALQ